MGRQARDEMPMGPGVGLWGMCFPGEQQSSAINGGYSTRLRAVLLAGSQFPGKTNEQKNIILMRKRPRAGGRRGGTGSFSSLIVSKSDLFTFLEQVKDPWDVKGLETRAVHPAVSSPGIQGLML